MELDMIMNRKGMEGFTSLEEKLRSALSPVRPDPGFVTDLETRLSSRSSVVLEQHSGKLIVVFVGLGLFVGAFVIWLLGKLK